MLSESLACVECGPALQSCTERSVPHAKTATGKDSKHIMLAAENELRDDRSNESSDRRTWKIESDCLLSAWNQLLAEPFGDQRHHVSEICALTRKPISIRSLCPPLR